MTLPSLCASILINRKGTEIGLRKISVMSVECALISVTKEYFTMKFLPECYVADIYRGTTKLSFFLFFDFDFFPSGVGDAVVISPDFGLCLGGGSGEKNGKINVKEK